MAYVVRVSLLGGVQDVLPDLEFEVADRISAYNMKCNSTHLRRNGRSRIDNMKSYTQPQSITTLVQDHL